MGYLIQCTWYSSSRVHYRSLSLNDFSVCITTMGQARDLVILMGRLPSPCRVASDIFSQGPMYRNVPKMAGIFQVETVKALKSWKGSLQFMNFLWLTGTMIWVHLINFLKGPLIYPGRGTKTQLWKVMKIELHSG